MKVALIGTGLMGRPMAERILAAGHELVVYNRSNSKAEPLRSLGSEVANTAAEAVESTECVILMLADAPAIREVLLEKSPKLDLRERTVIQMGTISPAESIDFQRNVLEGGGEYLEAPVLGSIPEASEGKLLVMVGASKSQFDSWSGFLQCFGPEPLLIGKVGKASALKLALNQLIGSLTTGFALSLGFVERQGVEVDLFMKILRRSGLYAPTFDKKLQRMLDRDFTKPNFPSKHLVKDIELFRNEAHSLDLELDILEGISRILDLTVELGFADSDYSALFEALCPVEA